MKKSFTILILVLSVNISNAQWVRIGLAGQDVYSIAFSSNRIFAGTYSSGVYSSTNNGTNWTQTTLNNKDVRSIVINGNNVIAGTRTNGVYYSSNNGTGWMQSDLTSADVWTLLQSGNTVLAGTEHTGIYTSVNNGATWTQTALNGTCVNYLYPVGSNILAAVGTGGWGVFLSASGGAWTLIGDLNISVYSVSANGSRIYAGTYYSGINLSTDFGVNWAQTSFDNGTAVAQAVYGDNVFCGTEGFGVFVSNNGGIDWTQNSTGMGSAYIYCFTINGIYLYAGTGNGVYRRPLAEMIGIQPISNEIPSQYSLFQNYPNPFNPTTKIKFSIPAPLFLGEGPGVRLMVYDIIGREVTTLVNEQLKPGTYEVDWDASAIPSGVYFYILNAGEFSDTKKMILIK